MIQKVNSLSSNVYTSHGEILKVFFFFLNMLTCLPFVRYSSADLSVQRTGLPVELAMPNGCVIVKTIAQINFSF